MVKQTYKYSISSSIVRGLLDDYQLDNDEYSSIYKFFVTYSLGEKQSLKGRSLATYGWEGDYARNGLKEQLKGVIDLYDDSIAYFAGDQDAEGTFKRACERFLLTNEIKDLSRERVAVSNTYGTNNYLRLFYRIRDGFAHGKFVLKYNEQREKVVIIEDDNTYNVTARMVIKLDTLKQLIRVIDRNEILKL